MATITTKTDQLISYSLLLFLFTMFNYQVWSQFIMYVFVGCLKRISLYHSTYLSHNYVKSFHFFFRSFQAIIFISSPIVE